MVISLRPTKIVDTRRHELWGFHRTCTIETEHLVEGAVDGPLG